jgi:hypothetical protein
VEAFHLRIFAGSGLGSLVVVGRFVCRNDSVSAGEVPHECPKESAKEHDDDPDHLFGTAASIPVGRDAAYLDESGDPEHRAAEPQAER